MARHKTKKVNDKAEKKEEKKGNSEVDEMKRREEEMLKTLPKEAKEKLEAIKRKIEKFQTEIVKKFDKYIMGVALLPPSKDEKDQINKDQINVLVLIDDSDSTKMSKEELKEKLSTIIIGVGKEIDPNINSEVVILSEVWTSCYDAKYDMLEMIAMSAPVFDTGMLSAIKIAEIHKSMVLKKFEKYIVSYVLAGSLVQGKATKESDVDVFVVIDDTDVKRMTRAELKDKLRAIIIGMAIDVGNMTGIKNKLNIQVYILTDFWDNIKDANPIIFTFLRDGIPFYDRGIFMPWKQLLKMGKIKPSPEAIDMFKMTGAEMLKRVHYKINELGMEDIFYAILTPSQAALMLYGIPPTTPKETPEVLREEFVKKGKLLEEEYVKILEEVIQVRKDLEHGTKKEISGKDIDKLLGNAEKYIKRLDKLFTDIEEVKREESVLHNYENSISIARDVLKVEGTEKAADNEVVKLFSSEIIAKGKIPEKYLRILKDIIKAKDDYDKHKLTKPEVEKVNKDSRELIKFLIEYIQRKRGRELERTKIRVKHGKLFGEVILLGNKAFIIHDIDAETKEISKADITEIGGLTNIASATMEELEKEIVTLEMLPKVFIKEKTFEDLKSIFGKDVEILINY
jgi:uncharacterized protein (UPF0332 family)/predicted nucleotidyltransferase